jgi:hypothetical protein
LLPRTIAIDTQARTVVDGPATVDRPSVDTALEAANLSLHGKRANAPRRLTAIELRDVTGRHAIREVTMATLAGLITLGVMLGLLLR